MSCFSSMSMHKAATDFWTTSKQNLLGSFQNTELLIFIIVNHKLPYLFQWDPCSGNLKKLVSSFWDTLPNGLVNSFGFCNFIFHHLSRLSSPNTTLCWHCTGLHIKGKIYIFMFKVKSTLIYQTINNLFNRYKRNKNSWGVSGKENKSVNKTERHMLD